MRKRAKNHIFIPFGKTKLVFNQYKKEQNMTFYIQLVKKISFSLWKATIGDIKKAVTNNPFLEKLSDKSRQLTRRAE